MTSTATVSVPASVQQSPGHLFNTATSEYFRVGNEIHRATLDSPFDVRGFRMGSRFECYTHQQGLLRSLLADKIH
jgi:hypothetical protein